MYFLLNISHSFSSFTVVVVGKSETCRLSASISWDAFRKGWERLLSARTHINISFLSPPSTCWLTKTEEFRPYNSLYIWCVVHTIQIPAQLWMEWTAAGNLDPGKICKNWKSATTPKSPTSSKSTTVAPFSAFATCLYLHNSGLSAWHRTGNLYQWKIEHLNFVVYKMPYLEATSCNILNAQKSLDHLLWQMIGSVKSRDEIMCKFL